MNFLFFRFVPIAKSIHNFSHVNKLQRNGVRVALEFLSSFSESIFSLLLFLGV